MILLHALQEHVYKQGSRLILLKIINICGNINI